MYVVYSMADFFRRLFQKVRVCAVINPMAMMKMMQAKNKFTENHPKFVQFLSAAFSGGIEEDTIIEISVEKPGQNKITSNIKVKQSDLELLAELKNLSGK